MIDRIIWYVTGIATVLTGIIVMDKRIMCIGGILLIIGVIKSNNHKK